MKFAIKLERRDAMNNALAIAKAIKPIADPGDAWDRDLYLLGAANGVVDLRTGQLRPGIPTDGITMQTAAAFDADAPCPRWRRFVSEIVGGDAVMVSFLQRAIGYRLSGITTEQVLFVLYGTGANGKGTLTNTLSRALGDYGWNMPFATIEMHSRSGIPNDLAALMNRRFVIGSETNDGARLNEARVKALTGCDRDPEATVGARDLFEHYRSWAEQHGLGDRERLSATMFGRKMSERLTATKGRRGKVYFGLSIGQV